MRDDLKDGLKFTRGNRIIRMLIINVGTLTVLGLGIVTLLPAWAVDVLGGDRKPTAGFSQHGGVGALIGALMIAMLGRYNIRGKLWTYGSFVMPVAIILFSMVHWLPAAMVMLVGVGWGFMLVANTSNALVQSLVPDDLRGRVMGIYILIFFGAFPIGSMIAGKMAEYIGEQPTILISAILLLAFVSYVYWRNPDLRSLE